MIEHDELYIHPVRRGFPPFDDSSWWYRRVEGQFGPEAQLAT